MPVESRAPLAGNRRFEILRTIGSGGMGVVYEAIDRERGATVALKTLRTIDPANVLRFKNEFRALQDIHHPNLVTLGELFEEDGSFFFTMELVRGETFLRWVRPERAPLSPGEGGESVAQGEESDAIAGGLDEARLRAALIGLARGLIALHRTGRVHRDIKPSNVLVTPEGRVIILDFGLITAASATSEDSGRRSSLGLDRDAPPSSRAPRVEETHATSIVGTAHYMAPEQAARRAVGPAADWYSVGAMMYLALTGTYPFNATSEAVIKLKQRLEPAPPRRVVEGLPSDLEALCTALLRRDPAARPSGVEVLERLGAALDATCDLAPSELPFVGRGAELAVLRAAFDEVRAGAAAIVLIEGESGLGKSALMHAFLSSIDAEALVLWGRCYERESVPFKAFDAIIDALAAHLGRRPIEEIAPLLPEGFDALADSFLVLRQVHTRAAIHHALMGSPQHEGAPPADPQALRERMFSALRALLSRLAGERPTVIAIDDLQWSDADSSAMLADLLRAPETPSVLFMGASRTDSGRVSRARDVRSALPPEITRVIRLDGLADNEVRRLLVAIMEQVAREGGAREEIDADAIVAEAHGHPLFLDALARHRAARASSRRGEALKLDDALWVRVEALDHAARRLLELVAVAGAPIDAALAASATASRADDLLRPLASLRAARLVRGSGDLIEAYHDRVRETILRRIEPSVRRAWHGRIALAMETSGADVPREALAYHWGEAGDTKRAAEYMIAAGDDAAIASAFDRAAEHYRSAIMLYGGERSVRRTTQRKLAEALSNAGRSSEAARVFVEASHGEEAGTALELRRRAAECYLRSGYVDEGLAHLRHVLAAYQIELPRTPALALAVLLFRRAELRVRGFDFTPRREEEIPRDELARIDVLWSSAIGLGMVDTIRGAALQTHHLLLALKAGDTYRVARALALEIPFVATGGGPARARVYELLANARAVSARAASPHAVGLCEASECAAEFVLGRFDVSLAAGDRADRILREQCVNVPWELGSTMTFLAWDVWFMGDVAELSRRVPVYLREAEDRGDRYLLANLKTGYPNNHHLIAGRVDQARASLDEALRGWSTEEGFHLQHYYDMYGRAAHALYVGDGRAAHRVVMDRWPALKASMTLRIQHVHLMARYVRGASTFAALVGGATTMGSRAEVARLIEADARAIEQAHMPWSEGFPCALRGALAALRGDLGRAAAHYRSAAILFARAGMALYAAAARRRYGAVIGGDEGRSIVDAADVWMRERGVASPQSLTDLLIPGC